MRKLLNIIGLSTVVLFASCDMDRMPQGTVPQGDAFKDIQSIEYLEKGAYAYLRASYNVATVIVPDLQADYVQSVLGFTNTYGDIYRWSFVQNTQEVDAIWTGCYQSIAQCNFILNNTEEGKLPFKLDYSEDADDEDKEIIKRLNFVRGRVSLMRAMLYNILTERFCAAYKDETSARREMGLPLLTTFDPEGKPSRSSLYDVYDRIIKDIVFAETALKGVTGSANSIYLNIDCVTALKARVSLALGLYEDAAAAANSLIGNSSYGLADNYEEFMDIWTYDKGKEVIYKFAASKTEVPPSYGIPLYMDQLAGTYADRHYWAPDYIPSIKMLNAYEGNPTDYRTRGWFKSGNLSKNEVCWAGNYIISSYKFFSKIPGNPDLRTDNSWNFANTWKVFRIAEMYLIAAEAELQNGGDAKTPLNTLRQHRGLDPLSDVTMQDLKDERYRELAMEGFRLTDLKRWGEGLTRGDGQKGDFFSIDPLTGNLVPGMKAKDVTSEAGRSLTVEAGNYRFVWPIPADEIYANQNLANQQNPGWK